jgi:hypothetical protein
MRKPIGVTVPYREVGFKEDYKSGHADSPILNLEKKLKELEERIAKLEKEKK